MPPKTITVKKGEILQRIGDLNTKVYVVQTGLLRSYTIDEKGKEHIYLFAPEGWIIADTNPADIPAQLFIDVLEDATLIEREKDMKHTKDSQSLINRLSVLQRRVIMLMSATAMDRYLDFIETYPDIVQRVPQRMIASYLGITPEALSRVRHQLVGQK
ncbi:Crp/Fnr family transcriptional regulator [Cryomorphaceae bacterium 1068]|nr:Crp/Fnr family transcriptional regulator [Cryomorphaceae bacterium 1068]